MPPFRIAKVGATSQVIHMSWEEPRFGGSPWGQFPSPSGTLWRTRYGLLKPTVRPISVIEPARFASSSLACSTRRLVWYRCGGIPSDCLNTRQK